MTSVKKKPTLTSTQKAILLKLKSSTALFEKYRAAVRELAKAEKAAEKARENLKKIEPMHVETLAEADPKAEEVFRSLGMLPAPPSETTASWEVPEVTTPQNAPSLLG